MVRILFLLRFWFLASCLVVGFILVANYTRPGSFGAIWKLLTLIHGGFYFFGGISLVWVFYVWVVERRDSNR